MNHKTDLCIDGGEASSKQAAGTLVARGGTSGGSSGFEGYLYQVDVSVWAALDLVLAKGMTQAIELEPPSHEDVEALLAQAVPAALESTDPGPANVQVLVGHRMLVIQAKLTSTDDWTHGAIGRLLCHGGNTRRSARERLEDPAVEYVLVTSGPLSGVARSLAVRDFTRRLEPSSMPASIASFLPVGAAGRVRVIEAHDQDRVVTQIRELLVEALKVPLGHRDACLSELRDIARLKMTGREVRTWTREEMEEVIVRHEGHMATSTDLARYVEPDNWAQLCDRLDREHAVIIFGCSGTGKTMTAAALWNRLHRAGQGYERVVTDRPSMVRQTDHSAPIVFDLDDPWGQYRFEPQQDPWGDRLPQFLRTAATNRKFIVTTREDVMLDARMHDRLRRWMVPLQPDDYSLRKRERMFDDRLPSAPRELQILLSDWRNRILGALSTPNEIDRLFANLRDQDSAEKRPADLIAAAIEKARYDAIELTIVQQVNARQEQHWAVIVWALLGARRKLTRQVLVDVQALLADVSDTFATGLDRFLNFFVAGRTLRQAGQLVSYYHPRAEAALAALASEERVQAARLVARLLEALHRFDQRGDWGSETAACVMAFVMRSNSLSLRPTPAVQIWIDNWLGRKLANAEGEVFREALRVAAAAGSGECLPAEFARFILDVEPMHWLSTREHAQVSAPKAAWYARLGADALVCEMCRKWVETVLPYASEHYSGRLARRLARIEPDITASFITAMEKTLKHGGIGNADVIAKGAVADLDGVAQVLAMALEEIEFSPSESETWRKVRDGVYSEGYSQHLAESAGEDAYAADQLVDHYVAALRQRRGWSALAKDAQVDRLGHAWARLLLARRDGQPGATPEELRALLALSIGKDSEHRAWEAATVTWNATLLPLLEQRVSEHLENAELRERIAACIGKCELPMDVIANALVRRGYVLKLLVLIEDLKRLWHTTKQRPQLQTVLLSWKRALPESIAALADPFLASAEVKDFRLARSAVPIFEQMQPFTRAELRLKVRLLLAEEIDIRPAIEQLFAEAEDNDDMEFAMRAASERNLTEVMEQALQHPFGLARARAFSYLSCDLRGLTQPLVDMHRDESRYVREAVVDALTRDLLPEYQPALETMVFDTWTDEDMNFGPASRYPIARKAIVGLAQIAVLDDAATERLFGLASTTADSELRASVLQMLISRGSAQIQNRMLALALDPEDVRLGTSAAHSLLASAAVLEPDLLQSFDGASLLRLHAPVAARLIILLGILGPELSIDRVASSLSTHQNRKVLLVLLARICEERFPGSAANIRLQMTGHDAVQRYLEERASLPEQALDALGDAVSVMQVREWLTTLDRAV